MLIEEIETVTEARMVWRKVGSAVRRAVRCTGGIRKGRVVSNPGQCSAPMDMKKRLTLKRTKSKMGKRMNLKARRTKRMNPTSKRVAKLNR